MTGTFEGYESISALVDVIESNNGLHGGVVNEYFVTAQGSFGVEKLPVSGVEPPGFYTIGLTLDGNYRILILDANKGLCYSAYKPDDHRLACIQDRPLELSDVNNLAKLILEKRFSDLGKLTIRYTSGEQYFPRAA